MNLWRHIQLNWNRATTAADIVRMFWKGNRYGRKFSSALTSDPAAAPPTGTALPNFLEEYFDSHIEGPGIWKWRHYFPVYDRHLTKFRKREVHILEIGVYSGGSLEMWRSYLGDAAHIYGVDIESACKAYETNGVQVFIGDQADPDFWRTFRQKVPELDIVIDDGGHKADQQIATLEALLSHLRPGGVYLCEDVHGEFNQFLSYVDGLARNLHNMEGASGEVEFLVEPTRFQQLIDSVHIYPFLTVIERRESERSELKAEKHGTEWEPFLDVSVPTN